MRAGGGKQKGAQFERDICRLLSLWVSHGKREDVFWRSAMSGGRATVAKKTRGIKLVSQSGDISSVDRAGHVLTDPCYFELKHIKDLGFERFVIKNTGPLAKFWKVAKREARSYEKEPVLIVRQNLLPTLWISRPGIFGEITGNPHVLAESYPIARVYGKASCEIWDFEHVLGLRFYGRGM